MHGLDLRHIGRHILNDFDLTGDIDGEVSFTVTVVVKYILLGLPPVGILGPLDGT